MLVTYRLPHDYGAFDKCQLELIRWIPFMSFLLFLSSPGRLIGERVIGSRVGGSPMTYGNGTEVSSGFHGR